MPLRRLCKSAFASTSTRANNLRVGAGKQASKRRGIISTFGPGLRKTCNQMQMESGPAAAIFVETKRVVPKIVGGFSNEYEARGEA